MKTLVQETFENEFNEAHFKEFVKNLFNHFDFSKEHTLKHQFNDAEREALNDFTYFGTYEDAEKKCLDILTVELKSSSKVERARSLQRNLIGKYLKTNLKDSALVAFYSKDNPDWRLSFVKMDYRLDKMGVKVEIGTPPKRYSFLVGKTEPSHTAQKQLMPLLDDRKVPILDEIEKSFSIEKVTKEFYTEIAKKFTELVGGERKIGLKKIVEAGQLKYPKPSDTLRKEFAVRLIGRLMFCWFLKKKKSEGGVPLIPNVLLSSDAISQYPDYYHSLLEPLFFQVLNTPIEKRNKSVRHSFWNNVPFLNGGLFEPHLYDYYEIYYESGLSKYINTLKVPDSWFLDLFKIFEIYNFTIDESTSIDIDISVDPEMLGRIFENLLAEINPETGETARKSTGSYYTPRPIVEYMVDESLTQYLLTQTAPSLYPSHQGREIPSPLVGEGKGEGGFLNENKISKLLSYRDEEVDLSESEKDAIIDALDKVKIIDPACGSGAFPMGILHKMLLILQKIDPESKKWLSRKLARIDNKMLRYEIEAKLKIENWDYVHKLGIIQNSVYGVDIQPIAVEISKLRFFLSLIVDEKIDDDKPNRGVVPLPNLEFKFVAANSLIGLPLTSSLSQMELFEARDYINKLKELRDTYFTSYGKEKNKIEQEFQQVQNKMFEYAHKEMVTHKKTLETQTLKLSQWNPFSDEASSWFDPEWMFGVKIPSPLAGEGTGEGGFDIVIANPPYGLLNKRQNQVESITVTPQQFAYFKSLPDYKPAMGGMINIFKLFILKSIHLLKERGIFSEIFPLAFIADSSAAKLRSYIFNNCCIQFIEAFPERDNPKKRVFEAAKMSVCVMNLMKNSKKNSFFIRINDDRYIDEQKPKTFLNADLIALLDKANLTIPLMSQGDIDIIANIYRTSIRFGDIGHCYTGEIDITLGKPYISYNSQDAPLLRGAIIDRYIVRDTMSQGEFLYLKKQKYLKENSGKKATHFQSERIAMQGITGVNEKVRLKMTLIDKGVFCANSINYIVFHDSQVSTKFALGILNSRLMNYIFSKFSTNSNVNGYEVDNLPYPKIKEAHIQQPFITLVDQILSITKDEDYLQNPAKQLQVKALEQEIDQLVYNLYGLHDKEIGIITANK